MNISKSFNTNGGRPQLNVHISNGEGIKFLSLLGGEVVTVEVVSPTYEFNLFLESEIALQIAKKLNDWAMFKGGLEKEVKNERI